MTHLSDGLTAENGWYHARCMCGWTEGPFPDPETMVDALMEHAALAVSPGDERLAPLCDVDGCEQSMGHRTPHGDVASPGDSLDVERLAYCIDCNHVHAFGETSQEFTDHIRSLACKPGPVEACDE